MLDPKVKKSLAKSNPAEMNTQPAQSSAGVDGRIRIDDVGKTYTGAAGSFTALESIDLTIEAGEITAIIGASGSGKSTLLNMIAAIDRPTTGAVTVGRRSIHGLNENEAAKWRGQHVGVIFQFFQLLPTLSVIENVMLPMDFLGRLPASKRRGRALQLLEQFDIASHSDKRPSALSGGQQQRAAIARSLANDPDLLIADEPTGNLDSDTSQKVLEHLKHQAKDGKTVVVVTHDRSIADGCGRTIELRDGRTVADSAHLKGTELNSGRPNR